jgi:short-subunit dehydrogenase
VTGGPAEAVPSFADRYGPWALVAGASEGLGAAFARGAAARGCNVVLVARTAAKLESTAAGIRDEFGVATRTAVVDLAAPDAVPAVLDAVDDLEIGLLIHNAAFAPKGMFVEAAEDDLRTNIHVNCVVPTLLARALAAPMVARGRGGIALCSSMGSLQGMRVFAAYGAAKSYELILAEGLWDELRDHGVDAMGYLIGMTLTPTFLSHLDMTPETEEFLRAMGAQRPEECAERFFEIFGSGPRGYASDQLEQVFVADAARPRAEVVAAIGRATDRMS